MKKSEIFRHVLSIVASETELAEDVILDSRNKTTEVVDARCMLVHVLVSECGFYYGETARLMGVTRQCVSRLLIRFANLKYAGWGKMFEINMLHIRNSLTIE